MKHPEDPHPWNVTPPEARAIQIRLREQLRLEPLDVDALELVAGADLSFEKNSDTVYAGFVVLRLPAFEVVERAGVTTTAAFPYIPGLLSFREVPPLLEAWESLATKPDALIADGQGTAHPRRVGLACHLGLALDIPTVGCAKSVLVGRHDPPGDARGDVEPMTHRGEIVGMALRTRPGVAPIYVSPGHRCDMESAVRLVLRCTARYRLPETTRHAHAFVNELRRAG